MKGKKIACKAASVFSKITLSADKVKDAIAKGYIETNYGYLPIDQKQLDKLKLDKKISNKVVEVVYDKADCHNDLGFLPMMAAGAIGPIVKLVTVLALVGGAGAGVWYVGKKITAAKQEGAQADLGTQLEAQQANRLLELLHPKSYEKVNVTTIWTNPLQILDTAQDYLAIVDKVAIVAAASGIKNFDKVSEYYSKLTKNQANLADDIRKVLNNDQQTAFFNTIAISANTSFTDIKDKQVWAAPTGTQKYTSTFYDPYFKKTAFAYEPKRLLGTVTDLLIVPFIGTDKLIHPLKVYKMIGATGQITGKTVYVLVSQVTTNKPK